MSRAKRGFKARRRRKKILSLASGYRGTRSRLYRTAIHVVRRGLVFAYRDRRVKKREFRRLWISRINAASRLNGLRYSELIHGLNKLGVQLDRSVLADLAVHDQGAFADLASKAKAAIAK